MSGLIFAYLPGFLRVAFSQYGGDIHLDLRFSGDVQITTPCDDQFNKGAPSVGQREDVALLCQMSSTMGCPFPDYIAWLEAIVCGVQECAFGWDAEGPEGRLHWARRDSAIGFVTASWQDSRAPIEHRVMLETRQAVAAFYVGFRQFIESPSYDPLAYEDLPVGETIALVLDGASLDDMADQLSASSRADARKLLEAVLDFAYNRRLDASAAKRRSLADFVARAVDLPTPEDDQMQWFPADWDSWTPQQRRQYVVEDVFTNRLSFAFGSKLQSLRSSLVEEWLAHGDAAA